MMGVTSTPKFDSGPPSTAKFNSAPTSPRTSRADIRSKRMPKLSPINQILATAKGPRSAQVSPKRLKLKRGTGSFATATNLSEIVNYAPDRSVQLSISSNINIDESIHNRISILKKKEQMLDEYACNTR